MSKVIAVVGATGAQGGGLVRAILENPESGFSARALTRDPNSEKAQELKRLGAEVVQATLEDPESIKRGFEGAYGAFCVTFFWDHFSPEKETEHARILADACQQAGIQHAVWSTLEDSRSKVPLDDDRMPTLMGKYKVPHFDAKGEADELFRERGVPTTFLLTAFFWENFIHFGMGPQAGPDGKLAITLPMGDKRLPGIAAEDIGGCALGIFQRPELINKTVGIAGEHINGYDMAAALSKHLGVEIKYNAVTPEQYRGLGFPGSEDLGNMFQFKHDFNEEYLGIRDIDFARQLNPKLRSFEQWVIANKDRIPVPAVTG
jgi:uncharacterized protein YbjT (DUF2867 family)